MKNTRLARRAVLNQANPELAQILEKNEGVAVERLGDGYKTLRKKDIKALEKLGKNGAIDLTNVVDILRVNAVVAYVAGSEVGRVTKGGDRVKAIKTALDLAKVFKNIKKSNIGNGRVYLTKDGQSPVFQAGVNVFFATTKGGLRNKIFKASYHELNKFLEVLSVLDIEAVTNDDIEMIKRDFDIINRAMQEIAIDAAKDKEKEKGWKKIKDIVNSDVKLLADIDLIDTWSQIQEAKRKNDMGEIVDIPSFKMYHDCIIPESAYTKAEFSTLSTEEQLDAIGSEIMAGVVGRAQLEILRSTNKLIDVLVNGYIMASADRYGVYSAVGSHDKASTGFIYSIYDVMKHGYNHDFRLTTDMTSDIRAGIYNEIANSNSPFAKHPSMIIRLAIAAGMVSVTKSIKDKKKIEVMDFNPERLNFGTVTKIFKEEFIAEYGTAEQEVSTLTPGTILQAVLPVEESRMKITDGYLYKFIDGVCESHFDGNEEVENDFDIYSVNESFTGIAYGGNGRLYTEVDTTKVENPNKGVVVISEFLEMDADITNGVKALDIKDITKEDLKEHEVALMNGTVFIGGADNNLLIAEFNGKLSPIARLKFPANVAKGCEVNVSNVICHVTVKDFAKNRVSGLVTYSVK